MSSSLGGDLRRELKVTGTLGVSLNVTLGMSLKFIKGNLRRELEVWR